MTTAWTIPPNVANVAQLANYSTRLRAAQPGRCCVDVAFIGDRPAPSAADAVATVVAEARAEMDASPQGRELQQLESRLTELRGEIPTHRQAIRDAEARRPGIASALDDAVGAQIVAVNRSIRASQDALDAAVAAERLVVEAIARAKAVCRPLALAKVILAGDRARTANEQARLTALAELSEAAGPILDRLAVALSAHDAFQADTLMRAATVAGVIPG